MSKVKAVVNNNGAEKTSAKEMLKAGVKLDKVKVKNGFKWMVSECGKLYYLVSPENIEKKQTNGFRLVK